MALLRKVLAKNDQDEKDFPIKFSKFSVKKGVTVSRLMGLSTVNLDSGNNPKFPRTRTISKVFLYKIMGGHWHLVFKADKAADTKPDSPAEKLIRIDLIQSSYRIVYNADSEKMEPAAVYEFADTRPTADDIYRIVVDVGKAKGKWTEGFNCQAFVNEVMERLGTLPHTLKKL